MDRPGSAGGRETLRRHGVEHFREIEREFPNFSFNIALSEPLPEDNWTGYKGFIHQVLLDNYLSKHEAPEEIDEAMTISPIGACACSSMELHSLCGRRDRPEQERPR